jgi:hypothetical protein
VLNPARPSAAYCPSCGAEALAPVNGLAVVDLVGGIAWALWIGSLVALVLGPVALVQIKRCGQRGAGMAKAAIVLGCVGLITFLFVCAMIATMPADY